jgi:predicted dehydrogenase
MIADWSGDVVVLSGRNARALDYIDKCVRSGLHVLADKPWILEARDLPKLEHVLSEAKHRHLAAYDCMTQRFDIAYQLQRELVNDPAVFGARQPGSASEPAVQMTSSHFLLKTFNGVPNLRPAWYFDIRQQGEALADVGTHVVDLAHWTLFPEQALDYRADIRLLKASRWPTVISADEFRRVTGEAQFPPYLRDQLGNGKLPYYSNNRLLYTAGGIHIALEVTWEYQSPAGDKDSMLAVFRGTKSHIAVRAGREQNYLPEVDVAPAPEASRHTVGEALTRRVTALSSRWPGLRIRESGSRFLVVIPPSLRIDDSEYFLLLAQRFAGYVRDPESLPAWEAPNMAAKYYVTTHGVDLARRTESRP